MSPYCDIPPDVHVPFAFPKNRKKFINVSERFFDTSALDLYLRNPQAAWREYDTAIPNPRTAAIRKKIRRRGGKYGIPRVTKKKKPSTSEKKDTVKKLVKTKVAKKTGTSIRYNHPRDVSKDPKKETKTYTADSGEVLQLGDFTGKTVRMLAAAGVKYQWDRGR